MVDIIQFKAPRQAPRIAFQRSEMGLILDIYGRLVMAGEARDYAIGMGRREAAFDIFRRFAETPTWRITKTPALARAQGAFAVLGRQGQVLKRGRELKHVLRVFDSRRFEVVGDRG
ncbi:MAG: DUF2794 domain-containing protein [Pseudomonadota bacterium]